MGQQVGDLRIVSVTGPGECMARLLETYWNGSLQWWIVEDLLTKQRYNVHTHQVGRESHNEMEALAWVAK